MQGAVPYMGPHLFFFPFGVAKEAKKTITFFRTVHSIVLIVLIIQVQVLALEGTALFVNIIGNMMICIALSAAAQARATTGAPRARMRP
jgi:hypothetical protein